MLQPPLNIILDALLDGLRPLIPGTVPPNSVTLISHEQKTIGLGNLRGREARGSFGVVELKGGRVDAVVRFEFWGGTAADVETDAQTMITILAAQADTLRGSGYLTLSQVTATSAEFIAGPNTWRKSIDYNTLFEYVYDDTSGAESLIAQIPVDVGLDSTGILPDEAMLLTDKMVRWDDLTAPALQISGREAVQFISALSFVAGPQPSGQVTIRRTFEGAGAPVVPASFADFINAITDPVTPERNAEFSFASTSDWLSEFAAAGNPIELGDLDLDTFADEYEALQLSLAAPIVLEGSDDRFEITFAQPAFDNTAVLYMQAE